MMLLERFVSWRVDRYGYVPEWLFNWMLHRRVERKGYRW